MQAQPVRPRPRQHQILHQLIQEQGLAEGEYTLFFVTGEGRYLPISAPGNEVEELSGYVIDQRGQVFSFWLGWDAQTNAPALTEWEAVAPESHWRRSAEFRRARERVGLPPT